jgi:uncharacterized protein
VRTTNSPFTPDANGVRVAVRLTPKAAHDAIEGLKPMANGAVRLNVKVTAAPERGKANAALVRLLAKSWHLPVSSLAVVAGETDRNKTLRLAGAAAELMPKLEAWLARELP